jgi:hypothetical protein
VKEQGFFCCLNQGAKKSPARNQGLRAQKVNLAALRNFKKQNIEVGVAGGDVRFLFMTPEFRSAWV